MSEEVQNEKRWDRIRFFAEEYNWQSELSPPLGPYWCSGQGEDWAVIVAFVPHGTTDEGIRKYWPNARKIDRMQTDVAITFSERFPAPDWWNQKPND